MRLITYCHSFFAFALLTLLCAIVPQAWAGPAATTTTLTITSGGNAVVSGGSVASHSVVTLTASVVSGSTTLTRGQVNFCDASVTYCTDIHLLGTTQITSGGTAVLNFQPGIGSHSYKAVFLGTPNASTAYAGSTSSVSTLTLTGTFPTTTIAASGSVGNYSLTATVTGSVNSPGIAAPGPSVSFLDTTDNGSPLSTESLIPNAPSLGFSLSSRLATDSPFSTAVVADFNSDGKPDLYVSGSNPRILLGNGGGDFYGETLVPGSNTVVVADFNGDGKLDLAMSNSGIQVLLGKGDGHFNATPPIPISQLTIVEAADLNQDGLPDLIALSCGNQNLSIFLGNGDGTFTQKSTVGDGGCAYSMAVGDFNGDGIPDVAVPIDGAAQGMPGSVTILLGNGDGTFTQKAENLTTAYTPLSIAAADFNGDGILDLAVTSSDGYSLSGGNLSIFLGKGDGTFTPTTASPGTGSMPYSIAVGDFNGDGQADLEVGGEGGLQVFLGNGDGTFAAGPTISSTSFCVGVGDFNGDGLSDSVGTSNDLMIFQFVELSQLYQTATATTTGVSLLGTGIHQVEASYPGDSLYSASTSATTPLTAQPTVTVTPSSSSITTAQALTVTVAVSGGTGNPAPTGSVTLTSGSYTSAATALSSGSASITVPAGSLATGSDTLSVSYSGDTNYASATGTASVTVAALTFTISGTAVSVVAGAATGNTSTITITPANGFTGSVALTAVLASGPTGTVNPPTYSFGTTTPVNITGAGMGTATLTISTTAVGGCTQGANQIKRGLPWYTGSGVILACTLFLAIPTRRRGWHAMLGMAILFIAFAGGVVACGGSNKASNCNAILAPTTAGTYTITVTGTSGSLTETGTVTLTVQ